MSVLRVIPTSVAQGCCPPLSAQPLAPQVAGQFAGLFKALADPVRLRLLSLIASAESMCVCDLADAFDVTAPTISHHLRVLREAGLVDSEKRGTWVYYRAQRETLNLLGGLLTDQAPVPSGRSGPSAAPSALNQVSVISSNPDVVRLLGDPLRAQIVRTLSRGPATTSHLVTDTGAKQPNVSGHLKLLREGGVVASEPRGRFTYHRLVPEALQGAALHLADLAAQARANDEAVRDS